jgi:hypothetical protein
MMLLACEIKFLTGFLAGAGLPQNVSLGAVANWLIWRVGDQSGVGCQQSTLFWQV